MTNNNDKTIVAIMYDFDNTLSTKDMQEFDFLPKIGMEPKDFWAQANTFAKKQKMDGILAVMFMMMQKSIGTDLCSRQNLFKGGKKVEFYKGVDTWFDRINAFAQKNNVEVEHFIISSGLKPIIEGTSIGKYFKEIYACDYIYDRNGIPVWPSISVNYTSKVQFLYRIHKGVFDVSEHDKLNGLMPEEEKHVSFSNMIFIGDGLTDVPMMKLTRQNGGHSIGVYKSNVGNQYLVEDDRVNFFVPADYSEGSEIERIIQTVILKIRAENQLERITKAHSQRVYNTNKA